MVKYCSKCDKEKSNWYKNKSTNDGLDVICKDCRKGWNSKQNANRNRHQDRHYPTPHDKCVYAIMDKDEIVYIGESMHTPFRLWRHFRGDKGQTSLVEVRKPHWTYQILWYGDDDEHRKYQEKQLVQLHRPRYNRAMNPDYALNKLKELEELMVCNDPRVAQKIDELKRIL